MKEKKGGRETDKDTNFSSTLSRIHKKLKWWSPLAWGWGQATGVSGFRGLFLIDPFVLITFLKLPSCATYLSFQNYNLSKRSKTKKTQGRVGETE